MSSLTAYNPTSTQQAWDNHFEAFGSQDVDKILLDYTSTSVIRVYDHSKSGLSTYTGLEEIRACFGGLFKTLGDLSTLSAPVVEVEEGDASTAQVFLIWSCKGCGILSCHDTFHFGADNKITRQNVVMTTGEPTSDPSYSPKSVQEAWDNHFSAFGAQDVNKILLDYTEASEIKVHNHHDGSTATHKGLAAIRGCFTSLFAALDDLGTLAAPEVIVEEAPESMVFLIWSCKGCGFQSCHDTFHFDENNKITRQNIALTCTK
ncbi:hypothetical protein TrST_g10635 [Triparma strigata]|uniref:SnoaL-like domain-containing protein n=1 Tax=Triparma strigata TaxID=1606541 RepID=A0A9W7B2C6_9STRA|nr:hypothetical protein TrST_g10635 [Triparma strigata]